MLQFSLVKQKINPVCIIWLSLSIGFQLLKTKHANIYYLQHRTAQHLYSYLKPDGLITWINIQLWAVSPLFCLFVDVNDRTECVTGSSIKPRHLNENGNMCVCVCYWPVAGAGHQHAEQVVDDEGEDDGRDGAAGDGVAGILQVTW